MKELPLVKGFPNLAVIKNKMIAGLYLCFLLPVISSCITEEYRPYTEVESTHITLMLNLPRTDNSTRALDADEHENKVTHIYVLLFDPLTGMYVDKAEALETDIETDIADSHKKKFQVTLPIGTYDFMVLANVKDIVDAASIDDTMNKAAVITALQFKETDTEWLDPPTFTPFPMWGELKSIELKSGMNAIGQTIYMIRSVVRIDVILPTSAVENTGFGTLQHVYLYNRYTEGQVIPDEGKCTIDSLSAVPGFSITAPSIPSQATKTLGPVYYKYDTTLNNSNGDNRMVATIYTFEAIGGSFNDMLNNTCLVLGIGAWENSGGGVTRALADSTYYYRVDFINGQQDDPQATYLPLLRNHNYVVTVKEIVNRGFPEPGQAYRSQPYNLSYSVAEWEPHYFDSEINNGRYRLDISSTLCELNISTNQISVQVTTTHPDGWSAYFSPYPDRIDETAVAGWMDNLFVMDGSNVIWPVVDIPAEKTFNLNIVVSNPGVGGISTGYVHIVSGNLTNVITIKKQGIDNN